MGQIPRLAKASVTTDPLDGRLGQIVCFVAAVVLFALAVLKLSRLQLTEGQLVIGLLAAIACSLLLVVLGFLIPISIAVRKGRRE